MPTETGNNYHDLTSYPPFASKLEFMRYMLHNTFAGDKGHSMKMHGMIRLGNTDTTTWADSTLQWDHDSVQYP